VYRRIQKAPFLDWFGIDLILTEYHRRHGLVKEGLERARSRLDNYFANRDGRARRLSDASTIVDGDWERYSWVVKRDHIFQRGRASWISQQPDSEERFQTLSNLRELLPVPTVPWGHTPRRATPHARGEVAEQAARAALQRTSQNQLQHQVNARRRRRLQAEGLSGQ
jgi:hypothetical protein